MLRPPAWRHGLDQEVLEPERRKDRQSRGRRESYPIFAGIVLQSTRPFRVGERVRLQGGGIAGQITSNWNSYVSEFMGGRHELKFGAGIVVIAEAGSGEEKQESFVGSEGGFLTLDAALKNSDLL